MTIRLLLVDDDDLVRTGLKMIIESDSEFDVVGEAANGIQGVAMADRLSPDVVLMDIQMPEMDGIEATGLISEKSPDPDEGPRVLVLTTFEQDEYVFQALRAGASGFLLKPRGKSRGRVSHHAGFPDSRRPNGAVRNAE